MYIPDNYDMHLKHELSREENEALKDKISSIMDDIEDVRLLLDQDGDTKEQAQDELGKILDRLEEMR